jgi:hypothetical protein
MIVNESVIKEWEIYSASQFQEVFEIEEKWDENESDEEYIMRHLEADKRKFIINFVESPRKDQYEEYWIIKQME